MEQLTKADPSNAAWRRRYEIANGRIADILLTQGHLEEALKLQRTDLERLEALAKADPGNAEFQRDMSVTNEKVGNILMSQGDLAEALQSYQACLAIDQRLAKSDPDNSLWQRDVRRLTERLAMSMRLRATRPRRSQRIKGASRSETRVEGRQATPRGSAGLP